MKFLLDTDTCVFLIRRKHPQVLRRLKAHEVGDIGISTITLSELEFGVLKSGNPPKNHTALQQFLLTLEILDYDQPAAEEYGRIRQDLEAKGMQIGPLDQMIAAHARSRSLTLVTNNVKEFKRVKRLKVENWAE